jgi:hypothetical protein
MWSFIEYLRTSAFELTLAVCILWWVWVIWFPYHHGYAATLTIDKFSGVAAETYKSGHSPLWIILGLASALITLYGLHWRRFKFRKFGVFLSAIFWATLWAVTRDYTGEIGAKGMFVILGFMCLLAFVVLGVEQRVETAQLNRSGQMLEASDGPEYFKR